MREREGSAAGNRKGKKKEKIKKKKTDRVELNPSQGPQYKVESCMLHCSSVNNKYCKNTQEGTHLITQNAG